MRRLTLSEFQYVEQQERTHADSHKHTSLCLSRHFHNRPVPLWSMYEVAFVPTLIAFHGVVDVPGCLSACMCVSCDL